ncbi:MAG: butyrate kinase [Firmicutes bacterium]|nr:butyrate kinase [Bacillota bacterium]
MSSTYKILAINPGSTSTKIAVFENEKELFRQNIEHSSAELAKYKSIAEQFDFRKDAVLAFLAANNVSVKDLSAVVARGGSLPPIKGGAYRINEELVDRLKYRPISEHASNVASLIAFEIASSVGIPSYIYDATVVDELDDIARITGMPIIKRASICHTLNMRAVARRYAAEHQKKYDDLNLIVTHLGGGITSSLHSQGRMIDIVSDDEGPFSPERAGMVHGRLLIDECYSGKYDYQTMSKMLRGKGGLVAYLGTNSALEVLERIKNGDKEAELVFQAMAYQIAKSIGELATVVQGKVEGIILTGGLAYSELLTNWIKKNVEFIAPVTIYPGENELESLALGGLRVLRGEEEAHEYDLG